MSRPTSPLASRSKTSVRPAVAFVVGAHRRLLAHMAAAAFFGGLAEALFLVTVTRAAFAVTSGQDRIGIVANWFLSVDATMVLALGLVLARILFSAFASWQSARMSSSVVASIRHRLTGAFLDSSWSVQQEQRAGSLQEFVMGYSSAASTLAISLGQAIVSAANLVALLGIAIAVDPFGAAVLVFSVGTLGLLLRPLRAAVRRRAQASYAASLSFANSVSEVSTLGLELHVFHVQGSARAVVGALVDRARDQARRLQFAANLTTPLYTGLAYLALLGALAVVAKSNTASLGSLGAAMLVMLRSLSYGQALQSAYTNISAGAPAVEEIQAQLHLFDSGRRIDGGLPVGRVGPIEVQGMSFAYSPGQTVLRDLSFVIQPKEIVGIVGPSGGGKSTLVQLLLGLRDPDQGMIRADGRNIAGFDKAEWARKVTFVPQAAHLIAGTVADNIRFLRDGVSQYDAERAARLAHLHDDVVGFPEGYERQVGEQGGHLSGGQQQRLCIARALVEDPDVLILDEPTSALDVRSEHLIRKTLLDLKDTTTVIVIAHRLSTLDICDRIMVIQGGELRGFDTPHNLERSSDFYREALALSGMR